MTRHQTKRTHAFTLVELVVVITILAILGTIGFLSVGGYSSRARDSTRVADIAQLAKSLDLSVITAGNYPMPDNYFTVSYSWGGLWYQGTVSGGVIQKLHTSISGGGLDGKPTDPLKGSEYAYSILAENKAYQIKAEYENDLWQTAFLIPETAYAAQGAPSIAYVRWNFGGLVAKTTTGSVVYVIATPSILTNSGIAAGANVNISGMSLSGTLVLNGKNLIGASSYNPGSSSALVFSGAKSATNPSGLPTSSADYTAFMASLRNAYSGSVDIQDVSSISNLLSSTGASATSLWSAIVANQLGGSSGVATDVCGSGGCNQTIDYTTTLWSKITTGASSMSWAWYGYRPNTLGMISGIINNTWLIQWGGGAGWDSVQGIKLIKTDSAVVRQYATADGTNNLWSLWLPARDTLIWSANSSSTIYYKNNFTSWVNANSGSNGTLTADGNWTVCTHAGFGNVDGNKYALSCAGVVKIYDGPTLIDSGWSVPSETVPWRQTFYVSGNIAIFSWSDSSTCASQTRYKIDKSGTQLASVSTTYPISLIYGVSANDVYYSNYNGWAARCSSGWGGTLISSGGSWDDDYSIAR